MSSQQDRQPRGRLEIEEVRLIADLRVMHTKADELYQLVKSMKARHDEASLVTYADAPVLEEDIRRVDEIYLWYVSLKEEIDKRRRSARK